jgi:hypothetical protein
VLTFVLFAGTSVAIAAIWNRFFTPVPPRIALVLWLVCTAYQATTLFTPDVDLPGNLAYAAFPWKAAGGRTVHANTGIVFTQLAPWTRVARNAIASGELPLWNRFSACGAPLLANQQTAIFHPFTLLGLPLTLGNAFTLSASLRLFVVLLFTFVFLRQWEIGVDAALFGAVAYAFCTFHIVWLLFPLGLATMMLPACLAGVHEAAVRPRIAAYAFLVIALACSILGGHPESALWVLVVSAAYAAYCCRTGNPACPDRQDCLSYIAKIAGAFIAAIVLTAFFWLPTLRALHETTRFAAMQSRDANPANHHLSFEWLLPLVAPNVLGNPVDATYVPPRGVHPAVLNDYGEVCSSYAGLITLGCALAAPFVARRRKPLVFAIGLMLFALLTIAEVPLWRDVIRAIPFAGISLHQRLRIVWDLGVCIAAALALDGRGKLRIGLVTVAIAFAATYAIRHPQWTPLAIAQFAVPLATTIAFALATKTRAAIALVFLDLAVATFRYNPPAHPRDVYPVTGAIAFLQHQPRPFRLVAAGWSFIPDTPAAYGIEDVKTTDPVQHGVYMRLLNAHLDVDPRAADLEVRDFSRPFFDFLNIRYIFVKPGQTLRDPRFVERYRGTDGVVIENVRALPRYFFAKHFLVEPDRGIAAARTREIADFRDTAIVDRAPDPEPELAGGSLRVVRYDNNATELDVDGAGWKLLVTSDVFWPGWEIEANGQPQTPVTVNGAFLGCFLPPGRLRVVMRYR